jgi:hypothetical protein
LGDIGGLEGMVLILGGVLIRKITDFLSTVYMMPHIYYYREKNKSENVE